MIKNLEVNLVEKGGLRFPAELSASLISDKNGSPYGVLITVRDVTDRKWVEAQIRESEDLYRVVANNTYDWEFWQAPNDRFLYISPSCKRITGYDDIEFINNAKLFIDIIHPEDRAAFAIHQQGISRLKVAGEIEFRIYRSDKSMRWISQVCMPIFDKDGKYLGVRGSNRDITEKKLTDQKLQSAYEQVRQQLEEIEQLHETLREQAIRDSLTGLYNRRYMEEALKQEHSRAIREGQIISVVMLDMDDLKKINDEFGHIVGDKALQILGEHLRSLTRVEDIACRYGGDEFLIILHNMPARDAFRRAEEWRVHLEEKKVPCDHKEITITFTAGIASFPAGNKSVEEIIAAADNALYKAKTQGRNKVIVYNESE
jgi:diguanylate cyclase (GGDEF)-like protein/PAS domain S-box-containing protein